MKNEFILFSLVFAISVFLLLGCVSNNSQTTSSNKSTAKIQVVTSFRPFTLLVTPVAGNVAQITQILPAGADPHDYEPTPGDAMALGSAKIFFYDGLFLEPWAWALATSANPDVKLISFSDAVPREAFDRMKSEYANFPNTSQDPHLWLSPKLAQYFVSYVEQQLASADPDNSATYHANAHAFEVRLRQLDADYATGLSNCSTRTFLTSHAFLNYVAADYNLTAISIAGLSPNAEPSIKQMDNLINQSRSAHVMGVLSEPDETRSLSQSVASELNLPLYTFSTMEILPFASGNASDYITVQEQNLHEMRLALGCH